MGNIITTENIPVRRTGIRWYLIKWHVLYFFLNQIFWMVRCFLCGYYSGCFAGFWVWVPFGDGVHSSESHCDTARPTATETWCCWADAIFSAASQHTMIERAGSSRHSLPVPMSVVATTCWTWTTIALQHWQVSKDLFYKYMFGNTVESL